MQRRVTTMSQPLVIAAGWLCMFVAVAIPFCVSIVAAAKSFGPRCYATRVYFELAPLIAVCEPVGLFWSVVGWFFTTVTVLAYLGAILAGAVATWRAFHASPRTGLVSPVLLLALTGVVTAAILIVIASYREVFGIGGLTFLASIAALIAYVATALISAIVEITARLTRRPR